MNFDQAFDLLIGHEGGYVWNAADPGGETNWGVTARTARQAGYMGPMRDMPKETAKVIAKNQYWDTVRADELPDGIRFDVFDTSYNSGPKQAIRLLQRAVWVADDGVIGPKTLAAAVAHDVRQTSMRFNAQRIRLLVALPTWSSFGKGWMNRVAGNLETSAGSA